MSPIPAPISTATLPSVTAGGSAAVTDSSVTVDKNMFLQLLVAQLKNQDPLNPTDSTQFVTQLAQFQQLESTVNMGQDITQIRSDADTFLSDYSGTKTTGSTGAGATGTQTTQP